jgi:high-affinity K+ transport system ATPase subunit B
MFTVELYSLLFFKSLFPDISKTFVLQSQTFYFESSLILILAVWLETFSESLFDTQAKTRIDSKTIRKRCTCKKDGA